MSTDCWKRWDFIDVLKGTLVSYVTPYEYCPHPHYFKDITNVSLTSSVRSEVELYVTFSASFVKNTVSDASKMVQRSNRAVQPMGGSDSPFVLQGLKAVCKH
jgi:hypothetical protein